MFEEDKENLISNNMENILQKGEDVLVGERSKFQKKHSSLGKRARQIAVAGVLVLLAASCVSASQDDKDSIPILPFNTPVIDSLIVTETPFSETTDNRPDEQKLFEALYPISEVGIGLKETYNLTEFGTADSWILLNYTDRSINVKAIKNIHFALSTIADNQDYINGLRYAYQGATFGVSVAKETGLQMQVTALVPDSDKLPEDIKSYGATKPFFDPVDGSVDWKVSYVRVNDNDMFLANEIYSTEACQQDLIFSPVSMNPGEQVPPPEPGGYTLEQYVQEYLCNSIAFPITAKAYGLTYQEYVTKSRSKVLFMRSTSLVSRLELTEEIYNSLNVNEPPIK